MMICGFILMIHLYDCVFQISTSAAQFLVCVMEENAPTLLVVMSAPVHEATSPAQMAPDVLVRL